MRDVVKSIIESMGRIEEWETTSSTIAHNPSGLVIWDYLSFHTHEYSSKHHVKFTLMEKWILRRHVRVLRAAILQKSLDGKKQEPTTTTTTP